MRILLIDQYAGSLRMGMEYRPFCLAREWEKMGDQVLVVSGSYSHLRRKNPAPGLLREDGVSYRILSTPFYQGNGWRRAANVGRFVWELSRNEGELAAFSPDAVICSSTHPFDFRVGKHLAGRCGAALVFELHDIWPLSLTELYGFSPDGPLMRLIAREERRAFEESDGVVSLLPDLSLYLQQQKIHARRLTCIPNGAVCASEGGKRAPARLVRILRSVREGRRGLVLYAGGFARANAVDRFVAHARSLPDVGFAAIGEGREKADLLTDCPENLCLLPGVSPDLLGDLLRRADLLWIGTRDLPFYQYGISMNKLFDYMAAGRPVVFETPCVKNPVSDCGCGITVSPSDKIAVRRAIEELLQLSPAERGIIGERGRRAVAGRYSYPALAKRYRVFLEELLDVKRTR